MGSRRKRSKTRSGASRELRDEQRLASVTFYLDYQIGRFVVAESLRAAGARVEVHIDHFEPAAPNTEWIPEVGRRNWVLVTKTGADIAANGASVWKRYEARWGGVEDRSLSKLVKTHFGEVFAAKLFERVTWYSAQHCRQLVAVLERMGIPPGR
jgi:hypothetical protein